MIQVPSGPDDSFLVLLLVQVMRGPTELPRGNHCPGGRAFKSCQAKKQVDLHDRGMPRGGGGG